MNNREKTSALSIRLGGFIGLALFVVYGLKAAFVYGGLIGVMTASAILGHPVGAELTTRILMAGGMLLGVLAVGSIMTVLGAVLGAAFDALVLAPLAKKVDVATPAEAKAHAHVTKE